MPSLPLRLSALQIIGLKSPVDCDWARLRCLQYRDLHRHSVLRMAVHGIAALMVASFYLDAVPGLMLFGWLFALALAIANTTHADRGLADIDHCEMGRGEFRRHAFADAALAALWAYALIVFAPLGSTADHYAMWTLLAMIIAGSAAMASQAPISTLCFTAICGGAAAMSFALAEAWAFAAACIVYAVIVAFGSMKAARAFLAAGIAETGIAQKDEAVSLLLREFEENEADWLWQIDADRRVVSASPRFAYALGCDPKQIEGERLIRLVAGEAWESGNFAPSLHDLAELLKRREGFSNLLVQVDLPTGRRWWELSGTPLSDESGGFQGFRGVGSDVTEQRESDEKIAYLARYDTLTGLPNRLMLTEALAAALRYADQWKTKCAFLMIDLDRFKAVNDSLGHQMGDRLLTQVSQRLKGVLGENEQCGRLGGDEFAVVIRDAEKSSRVADIAEAVIEALSAPYQIDGHTLYIGASVGSAMGPRDGTNVETLMRNADLALDRAKNGGGEAHCRFMPSLHADAEERRKLEASLRNAIGNDELQLHFQPVVDSHSEQVVSFEALLRWNSKEHGFVSPGKFIPLAEDTRLIVPIGNWVLREACREATKWPSDIRIAVNVSGEQLVEPGFAQTVVQALADSGLPAHRLEIEVTESVFLRDGRTARQSLEEIMALGCTIALDDFGTGYSSLGYLKTLRFSTIKVDRSFVQGAASENRESVAIIRAVVAMAQSLDMSTTAEGVEDAEQAAMIREMGCAKIQGFYFGRPMPAAEARSLVVRRRSAA